MKKSGTGRRLFLFILTAAMILTMQDFSVLAGQAPLENQPEGQLETPTEQPESQSEQPTGTPNQTESQSAQPTEQPDEVPESGEGTLDGSQEGTPETSESFPLSEPMEVDNNLALEADTNGVAGMSLGLDDETLAAHIVSGENPDQAVVNLFDYWQYPNDPAEELAHDWEDTTTGLLHTTYNIGISKGHLLRFGYRELGMKGTQAECQYCFDHYYGDWNQYKSGGPREGIVKNRLGTDGFPILNFKDDEDYGDYQSYPEYLNNNNESLAYLFSLNDNEYKKSYTNVQGLFQMDDDGYYRYDSTINFAELDANDPGNPHFILYDSPGVGKLDDPDDPDSDGDFGQFFPFNEAGDVFNKVSADGKRLYYENNSGVDAEDSIVDSESHFSFLKCYAPVLNHYLGMTLEVPFLQPVGGQLPNKKDMSFEFSGDDDVWIFIDDVLVADLGGLHDACSLSINFQTGEIEINGQRSHTLYDSFEKAYGSGNIPANITFSGQTFADNTVHTLKMFYLERGYMASNLSLSFNLQTARYNQIKKVDQNGNAVENVEFALYPARKCNAEDEGSILCNSIVDQASVGTCYVKQNGETPLLTLKTGPDGIADFSNYTFSPNIQYYILHETAPPDGYRSQPVDIVLEYNSKTTMLSVANRWETGAYASFTSYVSEQAGADITYGQYVNGAIEPNGSIVERNSRQYGLILAVPMLRRGDKDNAVWLPLYGSNLDGFHTTGTGETDNDSMIKALLTAALNQCLYDEGWYLEWNTEKSILEGRLSDLPGRADRYLHENPNGGDMQMAYIMIEPAGFTQIGVAGGSSTDRYAALKQYVGVNGVDAAVNAIYGGSAGANVNLLDATQFIRVFRSLIYISNEQRELRVMKVDENGQPLNGAQFGLYASIEDAQKNRNAVAVGVTANVDGVDGILIFKPQTDGEPGYARMVWADTLNQPYYLKEISAPKGYRVNKTIIPVVVGIYSIYADAGSADDGVSVMAGAGQLYRTMAKYASDGDVSITLRDITVTAQTQDSGQFALNGWQDMEESGQKQEKNLHYDMNTEMGMDYGLHDEDLGLTPFFITDTGFIRVRVSQNTQALEKELYNGAVNVANRDNLEGIDLTGLFSLLNVVVVEDQRGQDSDDDHDGDDYNDDYEMTDTDTSPDAGAKASPAILDVLVEHLGTPQTGDDSLIWWWAVLGIISLVGIGATVCNLVFVKKKQKEHPSREKEKPKKHLPKEKQKKDSSKKKRKKRSSKK